MKVNKAILEHLVKIARTERNPKETGTSVSIKDFIYMINFGENVEIKNLNKTDPSSPKTYFHSAVYKGYLFRTGSEREIYDSDDFLEVTGIEKDSDYKNNKGSRSTLSEKAEEFLEVARRQKETHGINLNSLNESDFIDLLNFSLENDKFKKIYLNNKGKKIYCHLITYIDRGEVFRFSTKTKRKIYDL